MQVHQIALIAWSSAPECSGIRTPGRYGCLMDVLEADPGGMVDAEPPKPRFRGWLHEIFFFVSIPAGLALVAAGQTTEARVAAAIYSFGVSALYGTSAAYHRGKWSPAARRWMQRLDHAMIFVLIAATYTPFCLLLLHGVTGFLILGFVWAFAITGLVLALTGISLKRGIGFALYLILGWVAVLAAPQFVANMSGLQMGLIATGGVLYTLGAICLGTHWPDPFPATFGYHEVWHVMVVVAGLCLAVDVWSLALHA